MEQHRAGSRFGSLTTLFYRWLRVFCRWHTPPDDWHRCGLLIGSASRSTMLKVTDTVLQRFPQTRFTALVSESLCLVLKNRWPQLEIISLPDSGGWSRLMACFRQLWKQPWDLAVIALESDSALYRTHAVGLLSGARYLLVYEEGLEGYYWTVGRVRRLVRELVSPNRLLYWLRYFGGILKYGLSCPLALFGCLVTFVRVLPLLCGTLSSRAEKPSGP